MTDIEQARDFLGELNQLIAKTDMSIIRQAKGNAQIRLQRASKRDENTTLWYRLVDLMDAVEKCKKALE